MPTTPKGLPYPSSSDHTRLWEHFQALAEAIDAIIPMRVWTSDDIAVNITNSAGAAEVTFPPGLFTQPPTVVACGRDRVFNVGVGAVTTTSASITVRRIDGTATGSDTLRVIAVQTDA